MRLKEYKLRNGCTTRFITIVDELGVDTALMSVEGNNGLVAINKKMFSLPINNTRIYKQILLISVGFFLSMIILKFGRPVLLEIFLMGLDDFLSNIYKPFLYIKLILALLSVYKVKKGLFYTSTSRAHFSTQLCQRKT